MFVESKMRRRERGASALAFSSSRNWFTMERSLKPNETKTVRTKNVYSTAHGRAGARACVFSTTESVGAPRHLHAFFSFIHSISQAVAAAG